MSHKGTTVVAALVPAGQARSLGVDIETWDGAEELSTVKGLSTVDELPPDWTSAGPVILFSVKEAAFKALHPVINRRLRFEDITVSWTDIRSSRCLLGTAPLRLRLSRHPLLHRRPEARGIGGLGAGGSHGIIRLIRSLMNV